MNGEITVPFAAMFSIAFLPLSFAATSHGIGAALGIISLFAVATIIPIMILTYLCSKDLHTIRRQWGQRHGDFITGIASGYIGLMAIFLGL